jgi:twitching motility protein PilT
VNYANEIISYLSRAEGPCSVTIAPKAPPVSKDQTGALSVAFSKILDAADVSDTLLSFRTQAGGSDVLPTTRSGSFSFGIKNIGRFRVCFITQRGSKVTSITRVPYAVPALADVCQSAVAAEGLVERMCRARAGLIVVCGTNEIANSTFVYAVLRRINETVRKVIFAVEPSLTYLLGHVNSLVLQCEIGIDAASQEEAIQNAFTMNPDILFVGGLRHGDALRGVEHAIDTRLTILSSDASDGAGLMARYQAQGPGVSDAGNTIRHSVGVMPLPNGRLQIDIGGYDV